MFYPGDLEWIAKSRNIFSRMLSLEMPLVDFSHGRVYLLTSKFKDLVIFIHISSAEFKFA